MTDLGHAYIHCPELKWQYNNKDIYVNKKVVEANNLQEGHYVCFDLHENKQGQPQASSPLWLETNKKDFVPPVQGKRDREAEGEDVPARKRAKVDAEEEEEYAEEA